jgi:hypothetical protein
MEIKNIIKVVELILLGVIVILLFIIMPVAYEEKELYGKCDVKILCKMGRIDKMYCSDYDVNYTFNINIPK